MSIRQNGGSKQILKKKSTLNNNLKHQKGKVIQRKPTIILDGFSI